MPNLAGRFWAKVDRRGPDECWPWTAYTRHDGYGEISRTRSEGPEKSHRVAWQLAHGPIPEGQYVLHKCDNRPCCNDAHLFLGTQAENMHDMRDKGRARGYGPPGERSGNAKLTEVDVRAILVAAAAGEKPTAIAARYGVSRYPVYAILHGKNWRHMPEVVNG